jgi:hypothetical protein
MEFLMARMPVQGTSISSSIGFYPEFLVKISDRLNEKYKLDVAFPESEQLALHASLAQCIGVHHTEEGRLNTKDVSHQLGKIVDAFEFLQLALENKAGLVEDKVSESLPHCDSISLLADQYH